MTERSAQRADFTIERIYDVPPARVFAAWATSAAKTQWFAAPPGWESVHELDFRVGGRESNRAGAPGGPFYRYSAHYHDIVPNRRIIYTYTMDRDETRISVSLATIEFESKGNGTRLIVSEQGVFLDGEDQPAYREEGTRKHLESIEAALQRQVPAAP